MPVANGPLRLVFEVAFDSSDCKNAPGELPDPWKLHRVVVALAGEAERGSDGEQQPRPGGAATPPPVARSLTVSSVLAAPRFHSRSHHVHRAPIEDGGAMCKTGAGYDAAR